MEFFCVLFFVLICDLQQCILPIQQRILPESNPNVKFIAGDNKLTISLFNRLSSLHVCWFCLVLSIFFGKRC